MLLLPQHTFDVCRCFLKRNVETMQMHASDDEVALGDRYSLVTLGAIDVVVLSLESMTMTLGDLVVKMSTWVVF